MRDEVDQDQVSLIIQEAEQIAANQAVFLPLYAEPMSAVFWPDVIDGFTLNAAAPFTWNVETWILAGR
jgi:ABC-type transport system substrate-binding protein